MTSACIPIATGVPGISGPPQWWDPAAAGNNQSLDDPRWIGAYGQGFGQGTAEETSFRAVYSSAAGKTSLYLSWIVKFDMKDTPDEDMLHIGIGTDNGPLLLRVTIYNDTNPKQAAQPASIEAGTRASTGGFTPLTATPAWVNDTLRAWHDPVTHSWAIELRVPINSAATSLEDATGLKLASQFKLWYCYDIRTPKFPDGTEVTGGLLRLYWPEAAILTFAYPEPTLWMDCELGAPSGGCSTNAGVVLDWNAVGTNNPGHSSSELLWTPPSGANPNPVQPTNNLFARPQNLGTAALNVGQVHARFRLANWGSIADPAAPWTIIVDGAANTATIPAGSSGDINANFAVSAVPNLLSGLIDGTKSTHQCMFVELSGAGVVFGRSSVYRNMDFVPASRFERECEISVVGLSAITQVARDVFLAVEARNMPKIVDPGEGGDGGGGDGGGDGGGVILLKGRGALAHRVTASGGVIVHAPDEGDGDPTHRIMDALQAAIATGQLTPEAVEAVYPTYRVHAYYDTGRRQEIHGQRLAILGLQSSFGYHAIHVGDLDGWRHAIHGAVRISDLLYLLRVPNDGVAHVSTVIQAHEPGEAYEPEDPIAKTWPPAPRPPAPDASHTFHIHLYHHLCCGCPGEHHHGHLPPPSHPQPPPPWAPHTSYHVGDRVSFEGCVYKATHDHLSMSGHEPPKAPALWLKEDPVASGPGGHDVKGLWAGLAKLLGNLSKS